MVIEWKGVRAKKTDVDDHSCGGTQSLQEQNAPFKSRENHVSCRALQSYNSPGDWARELFKPSTDSARLVVEIEKKIFSFSVGNATSGGIFG